MFNIKELFAGITLVFLLGVGGFLYRSASGTSFSIGLDSGLCVRQVEECPDGALVGRVGQACNFAQCPLPNITLSKIGTAFVLPTGYVFVATSSVQDTSIIAKFISTARTASTTSTIIIRKYAIPAEESAIQVMLNKTVYNAGLRLTSMQQFATTTIGNNTFQRIQLRSSGRIQTVYYLPRTKDVIRFDIVELSPTYLIGRTVTVDSLHGNKVLRALLMTLRVGFSTVMR